MNGGPTGDAAKKACNGIDGTWHMVMVLEQGL
jgi:hypothetical protein